MKKVLRFDLKGAAKLIQDDSPKSAAILDEVIEKVEIKVDALIDAKVETVAVNGVNIIASNFSICFDTEFECAGCIAMEICYNGGYASYILNADSDIITITRDDEYPALLSIMITKELSA